MPLFLMTRFYMGVIVPVAIVLPLAMALQKHKRLTAALKWFVVYLLAGAVTSVVVKLYAMNRINNMPVFHVYTAIEFLLLSMFYMQLFKGRKLYRLIPAVAVIYILFCIANIILWQPLVMYNSYSRSVEAILVMLYTIVYFKNVLDDRLSIPQQRTVTWINTGLLLYFSGSLFLFIYGSLKIVSLHSIIWNIHASLVLLMYILFAIGFYHAKRTA